MPLFREISEIVLLVLVFFIIVLAVRIFSSIPSRIYRERFTSVIRYSLLVGLILGFFLPWDPILGLSAALVTGLILLFISFYTILVTGKPVRVRFLHEAWVRREVVREWLVYFSIVTGVIGIVSTVMSIVIPPFLSLTLSTEVPLAFDTISVTSALLEITVPITSYRKIYALLYLYFRESGEAEAPGAEGLAIYDTDFLKVVEQTEFTEYEVRDALESLVETGMATKMTPTTQAAKVEFRVSQEGLSLIRLYFDETTLILKRSLESIEQGIESIEKALGEGPGGERVKSLMRAAGQLYEEADTMYRENRCFEESGQCRGQLQRLSYIKDRLRALLEPDKRRRPA